MGILMSAGLLGPLALVQWYVAFMRVAAGVLRLVAAPLLLFPAAPRRG
ncbi:hypothetical protein [Streptomyces sp. NPDC000229]